jgi:hypothetical protein
MSITLALHRPLQGFLMCKTLSDRGPVVDEDALLLTVSCTRIYVFGIEQQVKLQNRYIHNKSGCMYEGIFSIVPSFLNQGNCI